MEGLGYLLFRQFLQIMVKRLSENYGIGSIFKLPFKRLGKDRFASVQQRFRMASRQGLPGLLGLLQFVADSLDGNNIPRQIRIDLQLGAQVLNVNIYGAAPFV